MTTSLVATRVHVPPLAHTVVPRDRLTAMLERDVPTHKLVLVSAPAGYGKTTLLSQWARTTSLPVVWLTADSGDSYLDRFLRYLLAAWEVVDPDIRQSSLGITLDGLMPERDAVLTAFINVGCEVEGHLVFVIDDAHAVDTPGISSALEYLLDYLPPNLHLVLGARGEPPLPLSRYRARRELREIGVDDLRFTPEEIRRYLALLKGDNANHLGDSSALYEQTEGWATGLQLATLMPARQTGLTGHRAVTGRQRHIADYLREGVLDHLTPERRSFLVQTSIVDQLSGPLCDAITGSTGSQRVLEGLERQGIFTTALDENREWFRYHRLFADVLADELHSDPSIPAATLHQRASRWYLDNGLPDLAFRHAVSAGAIELAREVIDRSMLLKFFTGEVRTVREWLALIPDRWYASQPMFEIARSGMYFFTWRLDACARSVDTAARLVSESGQDMPEVRARVMAMRCFIACARNDLSAAERLAAAALETLPVHDDGYRAGVYGALGDTYRRNALWDEAQENYRRAISFADHPAAYVQSVDAYGALADLALQQGRLREAATHWQRALDIVQDQSTRGAYPLAVSGWVHIRFGEILYERNDLETAAEFVSRGRERAELGGDPRSIVAGALLAARLALARGDLGGTAALLEQIRPIATDADSPDWSNAYIRLQVDLWLTQGMLRTAVTWADGELAKRTSDTQDLYAPTELTIARVLITKGDHDAREQALSALSRQIQTAEITGRLGIRITALALRAMGHWNRGDRVSALISLEQAMRLAEPEGYIRSFADLGLPMARLLQEARHRRVMPAYVDRLLAAFNSVNLATTPSSASLPEPLSAREHEVLRSLAAGLTNREIAAALFISPETVKKHTSSIYGKLGVRGRTEAIARSLELGLLD